MHVSVGLAKANWTNHFWSLFITNVVPTPKCMVMQKATSQIKCVVQDIMTDLVVKKKIEVMIA
jgi:hypothetical protein